MTSLYRDSGTPLSLVISADVGGELLHVGDEAMLQANIDRVRELAHDARIALCADDSLALRERLAAETVPPPDASGRCGAELRAALERSDALLVSGGGNLCSTWPRLLSDRIALMRAARALGKPVLVTGQTLGPALSATEQLELGAALAAADFVGVRELPSLALASALGVAPERLWYQPDDALLLRAEEPKPADRPMAVPSEPWIAVTLDPSFGGDAARDELRALAAELYRIATATCAALVFIPHVGRLDDASSNAGDVGVGRALHGLLSQRGVRCTVLPLHDVRTTAWLTQQASAVISSRYHGLVFALAAGVAALGLHRDAYSRVKLQGALAHFDLAERALSVESAASGGLVASFLDLWRSRLELRHRLLARRRELEGEETRRWSVLAAKLGVFDTCGTADAAESMRSVSRLLPRALQAIELERRAFAEARSGWQRVERAFTRTEGSESLRAAQRAATARPAPSISEAGWSDYGRDGYLRLGRVLDLDALEALRRRADDLALGRVIHPQVEMQLDTGGAYEALGGAVRAFDHATLLYRKIQGLQHDPLFAALLQHPSFREICAHEYGPHVAISIFRAMVMNKPAGQGTYLPWHQDGGDVWKLDRDPLVTVWVALDPAMRTNGCIEVVPGTHRLGLLSLGGSTLRDADVALHCRPERVVPLEVEAGHAVLLHNWLVHRSGINPSTSSRRAFTACFMDHRTLSTLTGERFPRVFDGSGEEDPPHLYQQHWREERETLLAMRAEAERYALSLERERRSASLPLWRRAARRLRKG